MGGKEHVHEQNEEDCDTGVLMSFLDPIIASMTLEQKLTYVAVIMWVKGIVVGLLLEYWFGILRRLKCS
jgi:hypothetical protein